MRSCIKCLYSGPFLPEAIRLLGESSSLCLCCHNSVAVRSFIQEYSDVPSAGVVVPMTLAEECSYYSNEEVGEDV